MNNDNRNNRNQRRNFPPPMGNTTNDNSNSSNTNDNNQRQNPRRQSIENISERGSESKKSNSSPTCQSCFDTIHDDDALRLTCKSGHLLCGVCSAIYAESVLPALMQAGGPPEPKCAVCRAPYGTAAFERVLKEEQLEQWMNCIAMFTLGDGEKVFGCVSCNYFEVRTDSPPIFFCQNKPFCGVVHCTSCKVMVALPFEEDDEEAMYEFQEELEPHLGCAIILNEKKRFEQVLAEGNGRSCPGCGLFGRKDNMCTHMSCTECGMSWCYCCGLSAEDCDKAPVSETGELIYKHNVDWQTNPKRCPMYLSLLADVDEEWNLEEEEEDEEEYEFDEEDIEGRCLDKFHMWLTAQKLNQFKEELGAEKWEELRKLHPSVDACGFSDEEIDAAADLPLFHRIHQPRGPPRRNNEEGDQEVIDLTS